MAKLVSINPSNGEKLGEVSISTKKEIERKIANARKACQKWAATDLKERIVILGKVVGEIKARKKELSELATKEMGMPISDSKYDVDDGVHYFNWYLKNAPEFLSPEVIHEDKDSVHTIYHKPLGVQAAITPWNYPSSNVVWAVGQSLVSGNTVVYKTSEENPLFGKLMEEIFKKHLPDGVFGEVYGDGSVGKLLVNGDIDCISFTGSTKVGKYLYEVAARKFIKIVLELGGSAPGIIFDDADLDIALENVFFNRFGNCGQTCDGLKRLIVHENVYEKFTQMLKDKLAKTKVGDPMKAGTEIGPLVSEKQLKVLVKQVADAQAKGAQIVVGGRRIDSSGFYFEPTIVTKVGHNMILWQEEVFGPVLPVVSFKTNEEAIALANDTKYGLGSYIYSKDKKKALDVASNIETNMVSINGVSYVQPFNPFGGCKLSGMGCEHGKFGFSELTQVKIVSSNK